MQPIVCRRPGGMKKEPRQEEEESRRGGLDLLDHRQFWKEKALPEERGAGDELEGTFLQRFAGIRVGTL